MTESDALFAARQGRCALDAFQRTNPGSTLDFRGVDFRKPQNACIEFSDFEFHLDVDFCEAIFGNTPVPWQVHGYCPPSGPGPAKGAALFHGAVFNGSASFDRAFFGNQARFDRSIFKKGASFTWARFSDGTRFSHTVFQSLSFSRSFFGRHASFNDILVIDVCSFEESIFDEHADFNRAFFLDRAHFQSSLFGENASFEFAMFCKLAQFNNTEFGAGADFSGASFCSRAGFEEAVFGDYASFRGENHQTILDIATQRSNSLEPHLAQIVMDRAASADPSSFPNVGFSRASFISSGHQYATMFSMAEGLAAKIAEGAKEFARRIRVLFYPASPLRRDHFAGCDFSNRSIKGMANFSCVDFQQPPNFQGVEPASALDISAARFSFRATEWPRLRHWTTKTDTVTRLRRLRKIAKDIEEHDLEQSLFILQRMAERGVAWHVWWDDVLQGWGIYHLIKAHLRNGGTSDFSRLQRDWPQRLGRSLCVAFTGFGRPLVQTLIVLIYKYSSNFGRSIILPGLWFISSLFGFALWYSSFASNSTRMNDLITLSFSQSFPIGPMSRQTFDRIVSRLFPDGIPNEVLMISMGQTIIQTSLLFLIGLALRNRFRIR